MTEEYGSDHQIFYTSEMYNQEQVRRHGSDRGRLLFASCRSGTYLSRKVSQRYEHLVREAGGRDEILCMENIDRRFSDSETRVRLNDHVGGCDVFLFQALFDPTSEVSVDQNYMAFLVAARTFREHGARHVTGVVPYLAYARQDKPTAFMRESTTARLMADLSLEAGIDRLIAVHPHSGQIRGFYGRVPINMLETLTLFIGEFRAFQNRKDVVVVAPDVGASKFVTYLGRALNTDCAIASKYRPEPEKVVISQIIGDFTGKKIAIVLDDMISGGDTVDALVRKLVEENGIGDIYLGISHNLCLPKACSHLLTLNRDYHLKRVVVTNSIPQTERYRSLPFISVQCLSDTLARTINRIHHNASVSEVFYRPEGEK